MKFLFKYLLPFVLIVVAGVFYYGFTEFERFQQTPLTSAVDSFEIPKGSSIKAVARRLESEGVVKPAQFFLLLSRLNEQDKKIKAGEYEFESGMTPAQILDKIVRGITKQYRTQILEGQTFKEIVNTIRTDENLIQTLSEDDYDQIMKQLATRYPNHSPEGMFYPDTYNSPKNTTDLQFLQRSHDAMLKLLDSYWENHQPPKSLKKPYDALILASIVEKETADPADRDKVARVFLNRLKKGMLLQTDPTVIYGMGDDYDGNIRKKDLKTDTPYNTYTRKGLPPTPIATPSKASLDAVFNPAEGKMLYFVAKGDGTSHFSRSYAEHKRAVIKYLLDGNASRYQGDR